MQLVNHIILWRHHRQPTPMPVISPRNTRYLHKKYLGVWGQENAMATPSNPITKYHVIETASHIYAEIRSVLLCWNYIWCQMFRGTLSSIWILTTYASPHIAWKAERRRNQDVDHVAGIVEHLFFKGWGVTGWFCTNIWSRDPVSHRHLHNKLSQLSIIWNIMLKDSAHVQLYLCLQ